MNAASLMNIVVFDLETTGFSPKKHNILEIGSVVWDARRRQASSFLSVLIKNREIPEEIMEMTGIDAQVIETYGVSMAWGLTKFISEINRSGAQAVLAHNALLFDWPFILAEAEREGMADVLPKVTVIDTRYDIPWPANVRARNFGHIAEMHNVPGLFSHRAITDAIHMLLVLQNYDLEQALEAAQTRLVWLVLPASTNPDRAREHGFHRKGKYWVRQCRECYISREIANLQLDRLDVMALEDLRID